MDCAVCTQFCDPAVWLGHITSAYRAQGISIPVSNSLILWLMSDDERLPAQEQSSALHPSDPRKVFEDEDDDDAFSPPHPNLERRMSAFFTRIRRSNLSSIPELLGVQPHDASWVGDGTNGTQAVARSTGQVYAYLKASDHVRQAVQSWLDRTSQPSGDAQTQCRCSAQGRADTTQTARMHTPSLTLWAHDESLQATPTLRCYIVHNRMAGVCEVEPPYTPCELWRAPTARSALALYLQHWWLTNIHPGLSGRLQSYCMDVRFVPSQSSNGMASQGNDDTPDPEDAEAEGGAEQHGHTPLSVEVPIQLQNRGLKAQLTSLRPLCFLEPSLGGDHSHLPGSAPYSSSVLCLFDDDEGRRMLLSTGNTHHSSPVATAHASVRAEADNPVAAGAANVQPPPFLCYSDARGPAEASSATVRPHPLAPHAYPDDLVDLASDTLQRLLGEHRQGQAEGPGEVHVDQTGALPQGWQGMVEALHNQGLFQCPSDASETDSDSEAST